MTELHQHAGVQHARRGRSGGVADGRPGMQRPDRRDRGKAEEDQQPRSLTSSQHRDIHQLGVFTQDENIERVEAGEFVNE